MERNIDGTTVVIDNIQLFEKAFEGLAVKRALDTNISVGIDEMHAVVIDEYVEAYKQVYDLLPFPLYAIEEDVKYVTILMAMMSTVNKPIKFIIDNGLKVRITENKYISFLGEKWNMESNKKERLTWLDKSSLKFDEYRASIGFEEYKWALKSLVSGGNLSDYYTKFMPKLVKACNGDNDRLKYHLTHMLDIYEVPAEIDIPINSIIDESAQGQYMVDVFSRGTREVPQGRKSYHFSLSEAGQTSMESISERIPVLDYTVLKKEWSTEDEIFTSASKLKEVDLEGLQSVFEQLIADGIDGFKLKQYRGIILGSTIVYTVDDKMYLCQKDKYVRSKEVATNVEIIATHEKSIYFRKKDRRKHGVTRISVYKLSLLNGVVKLCNICFA